MVVVVIMKREWMTLSLDGEGTAELHRTLELAGNFRSEFQLQLRLLCAHCEEQQQQCTLYRRVMQTHDTIRSYTASPSRLA